MNNFARNLRAAAKIHAIADRLSAPESFTPEKYASDPVVRAACELRGTALRLAETFVADALESQEAASDAPNAMQGGR